jgi:hypothetical protein
MFLWCVYRTVLRMWIKMGGGELERHESIQERHQALLSNHLFVGCERAHATEGTIMHGFAVPHKKDYLCKVITSIRMQLARQD